MNKPLLLQFFDSYNKPPTEGLKFVLFQLIRDGQTIGFDYGFANFGPDGFEEMGGGDTPTCRVLRWCELPNPQLLL